MGDELRLRGYRLPDGIATTGTLLPWLKGKSLLALRKMDRGDPLDPASTEVRPKDRKLSRIEIFNGILDDYQLATKQSVKAGLKGNWRLWERQLKVKDGLAQAVQELGWHPVFHISDREYQRRMVGLIRKEPPRDLTSLYRLFLLGLPGWASGGLCFAYPPDFRETWREFTAEETVKACKTHDLNTWGECNGASRKVMALMVNSLSVYRGKAIELNWWLVQQLPNSSRGHSFIAVQKAGEGPIALDPSRYGFSLSKQTILQKQTPWRISMATYYSNLALAPGMEGKFEGKEMLYRKAVEINPSYDLAWNNLGWVSRKLGKIQEAKLYFLKAVELNPKNSAAQRNLAELQISEKKGPPR
jgi:Tfp pilus assembly protein PilF